MTHERSSPLTVMLEHRPPGEQSNVATVVLVPVPEILKSSRQQVRRRRNQTPYMVKTTSWMSVFEGNSAHSAASVI